MKYNDDVEHVKHDNINTRLDHDEFLEKFYETLDDQTIFEVERKKFEAYIRGYYDKECGKIEELKVDKNKSWVTFLDILHIPNYVETMEGLGGRRIVAKEGKWLEVGEQPGLAENGPNLRIIYDGYLELLDWMYSMEKEKEPKVGEAPIEERYANKDGPSEKKETEGVVFGPKDNKDATAGSSQEQEKQIEDGEIPDNELYLQEMLDANFDDDFELELLEYTERNKEDVAAVNEDAIQGLGGNVGP
ncbi:hypothetical protein E3N88_20213 [Mikania micrantha]|uniref:ARID domain-containing protein n=1 Tax=Mikania micrantha TaxID=192012 RepID=A0A5N6NI18_9ASTR|nr:hypothetical protein E3N88_20213 [Mikania micrantha]